MKKLFFTLTALLCVSYAKSASPAGNNLVDLNRTFETRGIGANSFLLQQPGRVTVNNGVVTVWDQGETLQYMAIYNHGTRKYVQNDLRINVSWGKDSNGRIVSGTGFSLSELKVSYTYQVSLYYPSGIRNFYLYYNGSSWIFSY